VLDLYAREGKRGGARTHSLVQQAHLLGTRAVVCNGFQVPRPAPGEPPLLTLDAVVTLFHEFGHALQALLSSVSYPSTSGLNVFRDFIEYPAQVNEMWALWPDVVANYAIHVETGERLPAEVIDRVRAAGTFNQGFLTTEHLAAATLDHAWHTLAPGQEVTNVDAFAERALERAGLDHPAIPSRYATQYFQHVFSGQYAARYYSYMWSEVLAADTIEWFTDHAGDLRGAGQRFRDKVLAIGGAAAPMAAYRDFRGRDASVDALLRRRGLH
jgi:peptidyl-dipeptidase Dcp